MNGRNRRRKERQLKDVNPTQAAAESFSTRASSASSSIESCTTPLPPSPFHWYECKDVLQRIFFKCDLGLSDLVRCRLVCKIWHLVIGNVHDIRSSLCCRMPVEPIDEVLWLRPEKEDMHVCPRSGANLANCWQTTLDLGLQRIYQRCVVVASAHGLLCLQLDDGQFSSKKDATFIVCNPVTGTHRVLPKLTEINCVESIGMRFDATTKSYTVFVTGTKSGSSKSYFHANGDLVKKPFYVSHVVIYELNIGVWKHHSHFITDAGVEKGNIAWWRGQYHWIVQKRDDGIMLVSYDMLRKQWVDADVRTMEACRLPCLFVWGGSLLCKYRHKGYGNSSKYFKLEQPSTISGNKEHSRGLATCRKIAWQNVNFHSHKSAKKATSLHVATHFSQNGRLRICIFDPYSFAPAESILTSPRKTIISEKRQAKELCFSFTPCLSSEV